MTATEGPLDAPFYLPGYDTEQPSCVEGVRSLVAIHERLAIPATFFLVGILVEHNRDELRALLGHDLFEVSSHTYSHRHLESAPITVVRDELRRTQDVLLDTFGVPARGFRSPGGLPTGYRGDAERVAVFAEMGFAYVSSVGRGPGGSMPAPLAAPFGYGAEGAPGILEMPFHGYHENLLTGVHPWESPSKPLPPEAPRDVGSWTAPFVADLRRVQASSLPYYGPTMHPWSLRRFDRDCRQVEALLVQARRLGFRFATYLELRRRWLPAPA